MKKISQRLLAAAVVAAVGVSASAEVLSPEQALGRALPQARRAAPALSQPVLAYTAEADELPAVYVFAKENKGFLLVSADDAVTPLLGYADAGRFDADNMAPAFKYWVDEYARQIAYARENNVESSETVRMSRAGREAIAPLVKTKWNQDQPYNLMCPQYKDTYLFTGCVATAVAQIAKYYELPAQWSGEIKGSCSIMGNSTTLTMDLDENPLRWDLMLDEYTAANPGTEEQQMAVATLMAAIGYGVNMSYNADASGALTQLAGKVLSEHFGYNKGAQYLQRDCYTLADWENIIYDQLKNVGPVLYDGNALSVGGHAFVCDGYQETDGTPYFHFNWGWGGTSDGYFILGALEPPMQGIGGADGGFDYDQDIYVNLTPHMTGEATPMVTFSGTAFNITPAFNLGREVTVTGIDGGFMNHSYYDFICNLGLHIVGEGQDFYRWNETPDAALPAGRGYTSYSLLLSGLKQNSTYVVTLAYRVDGKIYEMPVPYSSPRAFVLKTSVHNGTFEPVGTTLKVSDVTIPAQVNVGSRTKISATFSNPGDTYFYGHAGLAFVEKVYGEYQVVTLLDNFTVNLEPGQEYVYTDDRVRLTEGSGLVDGHDYYLVVVNPETGEILSDMTKFHFGSPSVGISDITTDAAAVTLFPNPAESDFTVKGAEVSEVNVYSLSGVLSAKAAEATVDVSALAAGIYLVEVVDAEGNRTTLRLIKK